MFVLNVMLQPKIHLYIIATSPPRDHELRLSDFTSDPLGANLIVFASSPKALSHVSVTKMN